MKPCTFTSNRPATYSENQMNMLVVPLVTRRRCVQVVVQLLVLLSGRIWVYGLRRKMSRQSVSQSVKEKAKCVSKVAQSDTANCDVQSVTFEDNYMGANACTCLC